MKLGSYDSDTPIEGKNVQDTKQLTPGAREPYATGTNQIQRQTTKHPNFGTLGAMGTAKSKSK